MASTMGLCMLPACPLHIPCIPPACILHIPCSPLHALHTRHTLHTHPSRIPRACPLACSHTPLCVSPLIQDIRSYPHEAIPTHCPVSPLILLCVPLVDPMHACFVHPLYSGPCSPPASPLRSPCTHPTNLCALLLAHLCYLCYTRPACPLHTPPCAPPVDTL